MSSHPDAPELAHQLDRLGHLLEVEPAVWHRHAPAVSGWSVGQQVEHTLRSMRRMFAAVRLLVQGDDARIGPPGHPNSAGERVLSRRAIPRGTAQAPETVHPGPGPDAHALRPLHARLGRMLDDLGQRADQIARARGTLPHPLLGAFDAEAWMRLARVHTAHHLSIIDDILQPARTAGAARS